MSTLHCSLLSFIDFLTPIFYTNCSDEISKLETGFSMLFALLLEWGDWLKVSRCSVSCGGGEFIEIRICINGPGCVGNNSREIVCNTMECPGECNSVCLCFIKTHSFIHCLQ